MPITFDLIMPNPDQENSRSESSAESSGSKVFGGSSFNPHHLLEAFSYYLSTGEALDLGCGNGRNALYLASLGCSVTAVDQQEAAVETVRTRAEEYSADVNVVQSKIEDFSLEPESFDTVVLVNSFQFVSDGDRVIEDIKAALKPGGTFFLQCFSLEEPRFVDADPETVEGNSVSADGWRPR